jgi:hypothetical protein
MTDDAPQVTIWDYHPVTSDSGDVLLTPNDITSSLIDIGMVAATMSASTGSKGKTKYFYNYVKDITKTGCLF